MAIQLPPDVEASIREQVERGRYPDESEVVREAMRLLAATESQRDLLRDKVQIGIDEADRGELDEWTPALGARLRREAEAAFHRGDVPDPDVCP